MVLAHLIRGPWDEERLVLPTEEPWPRLVIPERGKVLVQFFYLLSGPGDFENEFYYLYELL